MEPYARNLTSSALKSTLTITPQTPGWQTISPTITQDWGSLILSHKNSSYAYVWGAAWCHSGQTANFVMSDFSVQTYKEGTEF
jgi:hypothetical protein